MIIPKPLARAIESGTLTSDQARHLAEIEARQLGLTLDQAIQAAQQGQLPKSPLGSDVEFLVAII